MTTELLTTDELSARIKYDVRTIRERLMNTVLIEGEHFFRPFGGAEDSLHLGCHRARYVHGFASPAGRNECNPNG